MRSLLLLGLAALAVAQWQKILLTDAAQKGAVCLDGSPGGFYFRKGTTNNWIVFHQGGGWCSSDQDCLSRSQTALGSSKSWGPTYTDTYEASALFDTPPFNTWNQAYVMYCDGTSWTSEVAKPVPVGSSTIYYRGRPLLDALIDQLLTMGLSQAKEAIYGRCSAGGLTAYLHADYFKSRVPAGMRVSALADAMFVLDIPTFAGQPNSLTLNTQWGFQAWNSSRSVPANCQAAVGKGKEWRCMFGAVVAPFVKLPLFIVNSKYDSWQQVAILEVNCSAGNCPAPQEQYWIKYGQQLITAAQALPANIGGFWTNCVEHCMAGTSGWDFIQTNAVLMKNAFIQWYSNPTPVLWLPTCDEKPCQNDKCS
jgi:hypothetical protein